MPTSRRKFFATSLLSIPAIRSVIAATPVCKPIVIATWDSGKGVNEAAWQKLNAPNGRAIDAVEAGAISIENTINCCVGLGGNPDRDGHVTLDACIMDEHANCGSVAFLERIQNPISVARKVMEQTPHVMLVGEGAQKFALQNGFRLESGKLSEDARKTFQNWLKKSEYKPQMNIEKQQSKAKKRAGHGPFSPSRFEDGSFNHDTMGLVALDASGNLSGACTTSGMAFKMRGRVGDSPIIGSGLYVDNEVGAAVATGQGEEVIRVGGTALIVELMRQGKSPKEACKIMIERIVKINPTKAKDFQVAFIALNKNGEYGGYCLQPGFTFCVKSANDPGTEYKADSYFTS